MSAYDKLDKPQKVKLLGTLVLKWEDWIEFNPNFKQEDEKVGANNDNVLHFPTKWTK